MYLARVTHRRTVRYLLRESYPEGGIFRSRDVFDLGSDPGRFLIYPGGNAFYFSEDLEEALTAAGQADAFDELEDLFWPFLKPDIRRALSHFHHRRTGKKKRSKTATGPVHLFDRRRLFYLKCGRVDGAAIGNVPEKLFAPLQGRSRDEIEQLFLQWELILKPMELRRYVYVTFDLQRHFTQAMAKRFPSAMDPEEMDMHFTADLCRLHADSDFWNEFTTGEHLHPYLVRYAVMYFDNPFPRRDFMNDYIREFIDSRRDFRFPPRPSNLAPSEIGRRLDLTEDGLRHMTRRELTRHFRKMALSAHPDHGGNHERFIKITEAYQAALHRKK